MTRRFQALAAAYRRALAAYIAGHPGRARYELARAARTTTRPQQNGTR